jgi:hypothetical protein
MAEPMKEATSGKKTARAAEPRRPEANAGNHARSRRPRL